MKKKANGNIGKKGVERKDGSKKMTGCVGWKGKNRNGRLEKAKE